MSKMLKMLKVLKVLIEHLASLAGWYSSCGGGKVRHQPPGSPSVELRTSILSKAAAR
jgi:hypothetical protein